LDLDGDTLSVWWPVMADRPPRRASLRVRLELGLAAFVPVFVLLAVRTRDSALVWLFVVPAAAGVAVLVFGIVVVATGNAERFTFGPIDDLGGEILGHVGAYLLPLIISPSSSTEDVLTTAIIIALIVHIHIATGRVLVNPLLYLLGRRVYNATVGGDAFYLVAKSDVSRWISAEPCVQIGTSVLVEKRTRDRADRW
jgi:hypothetical protein